MARGSANLSFCIGRYWHGNLSWPMDNERSSCAEKIFLWSDAIVFFFAVILSLQMFQQRKVPRRCLSFSPLFLTKMILAFLFLLLQILIINHLYWITSNQFSERAGLLAPILLILTTLIVIRYTKDEQFNEVYTSGLLFCFWFLVGLSILPDLFVINLGNGRAKTSLTQRIRIWLHFLLSLASLICHCFVEKFNLPNKEKHHIMPEPYESFPSRLTFWWVNQLVLRARTKPLSENDWWILQRSDQTMDVVERVHAHMYRSCKDQEKISQEKHPYDIDVPSDQEETLLKDEDDCDYLIPGSDRMQPKDECVKSVWYSLLCAYKGTVMLGGVLKLIFDLLALCSPLMLKALLKFFENNSNSTSLGITLTILFTSIIFSQTMFFQYYMHQQTYFSLRCRSAIAGLVYRKSLKLSNAARQEAATGEIVNLMSFDASRFSTLGSFMHLLWSSPLQMVLALVLLYREMGVSMLPAVVLLLLFIPLNISLNRYRRTLVRDQMTLKDSRVEMMNELLNGIKVVKLYAWETVFINRINEIRGKELAVTRKRTIITAASSILCTFAPTFLAIATFATYVFSSNMHVLTADKAFVALSIFNLLRTPIMLFPYLIGSLVEAMVSSERIEKFLAKEEIDPEAVQRIPLGADDRAVTVENGTFRWSKLESDSFTLTDINLEIERGSLVALVGSVASGKSSLLAALLGEMNKVWGSVRLQGRVGFVPQSPWILNATLRENILFGQQFDRQRYNLIVEACALRPDLDALPNGDRTEIGEKGINLSGGQRARVSLARALYSDADIYLLDDPLAAVDSHVCAHIFRYVIGPEGLLKKKTRVWVTHGLSHLDKCDEILLLKDGQINDHGSYNHLKTNSTTFSEFIQLTSISQDHSKDGADKRNHTLQTNPEPLKCTQCDEMEYNEEQSTTFEANNEETLIQKETIQIDSAKFCTIWKYIHSSGLFLWLTIAICFCLMTLVSIKSNIYLSKWTDQSTKNCNGTSTCQMQNLNIYFGLGFCQGLFLLIMQLLQVRTASSASVHLHRSLLQGVLRAPMSFFDCTPIGRIINRFAKDVDSLDNVLPASFSSTLITLSTVLVTTSVLIYSSSYALIAILPLALPFAFIQRVYIRSSRQLRQLDSTTKSPLYSNFTETLQGLSSIRAYHAQDRFIQLNDEKLDHNQACFFASQVLCRWLGVRLEMIANTLTLATSLFAVVMRHHFTVGTIGLAITFTMQITQSLSLLVLFISDIESNIVSVERIEEYAQLPSEAPWQIPTNKPPAHWPTNGKIQIEDLAVRHRENLRTVIEDVTAEIHPGEKIGIVGRTGSGKTTLCMALFRIIEAAKGRIVIDDVDISQVGLHDLRSKLTIIPQDAVIFADTVRFNVDPTGLYSDEQIWAALESTHIKERIASLKDDLSFSFTEGGNNLSAGEKQLLCMARALLRQSKIVVLDEATAAVDMETDRLIQMTVRTAFKNATVLNIAHRLHTIVDSTRILVLSNGSLQEFQSPQQLALNSQSFFSKLLRDANIDLMDTPTSVISIN